MMDENKKRYSFGALFWWAANVIFILSLTFLFGTCKASLFPLAIIQHSTSDRLSFVIGEHQGNTHHRLWVSLPPSATRPAGRRRYVYKGAGMHSSFFSWSHPFIQSIHAFLHAFSFLSFLNIFNMVKFTASVATVALLAGSALAQASDDFYE